MLLQKPSCPVPPLGPLEGMEATLPDSWATWKMADSSSQNSKYLGVFNCVVKIPEHCPELHDYTSDVWFHAAVV